ncbi:hypothetical protein ACFLTP_08585 [Chloroflexota bacterium]
MYHLNALPSAQILPFKQMPILFQVEFGYERENTGNISLKSGILFGGMPCEFRKAHTGKSMIFLVCLQLVIEE